MSQEIVNSSQMAAMSQKDFVRLREFIYNICGINLIDAKKTMLEARLQKRLRQLNLKSFTQYCDYLFSASGTDAELTDMINQVTTNKTDFFREPAHFEYLKHKALPELTRLKRNLLVWSAGCSSGEEPYTLAMVLHDFGCDFTVLATDISTKVLEKARLAIYNEECVAPVPYELKKKYLLRGRDQKRGLYRITPELREYVRFRQLNFMDSDFGFREPIDVIFCRNVIIYFDKATQERLLNHFCRYLAPHGYIFMGHSETLLGMDVPLVPIAPTIYRRKR